jgi:erythromycin esterase-like protein
MPLLPVVLPLTTFDPAVAPTDLEPLAALVGDARVVGLGECTHGSAEVFEMKARLLRELARLGFDALVIEASAPDTFPVDAYVRGAQGLEPAAVVRGMGFWTWSTPEVRDLAVWMRDENAARPADGALRWLGMDMQHPRASAAWLSKFLTERDPPLAAELGTLAADEGFAAVTFATSVEGARHFSIEGRVRTQALDGSAAFWARGERANGEVSAFDNMRGTGPRGTSGWSRPRVEIALPEGTERVVFGILVEGSGSAWFDDLHVTVDGADWVAPEGVDPSFDAGVPPTVGGESAPIAGDGAGWAAGGPFSTFTSESDGRHGAALRVTRTLARPDPERIAAVAAELMVRDFADLDAVTRQELALAAATMGQGWSGGDLRHRRDAAMADNVARWLDLLGPDSRVAVWAHNGHIRRDESWMGGWLADRFGDDYLPIGFACGAGTYTAADRGENRLAAHPLAAPPPRSFEAHLGEAPPLGIVDLRGDGLPRWLQRRQGLRSIGAVAPPPRYQFVRARLPDEFGLIVYLAHTTATEQLPR